MTHCPTILQALRQRGYRITSQREMIIEIIAHSDRHLSAEEVFHRLREKTSASNLTTVYRTLEMLWVEGFARRNDLGEGRVVYAPLAHGPHLHLVCRSCNRVIEADHSLLAGAEHQLREHYGFQADLAHLNLFGVCQDCREG
ncbi:MAG: transcriptional repressor [Anaerolineae bacterium]|nr:MAG: transcriptional repressor [Anaerolineae bacterium]